MASELWYVGIVALPLVGWLALDVVGSLRDERARRQRERIWQDNERLVAIAVREWRLAAGWRRW